MPTVSSKRRLTAGAALVVAALVTTTACGGGDGDGDGDSKGAGYNAALNKVANPSKKKGGTLRMVGKQDLDSADPQRAYYGMTWDFMRFYTRQLVTYDTKPGKAGTKLVPDLATSTAKISKDGKTYTYKLRDGLTWEDGSKLTSKDVKYGIERIWATDTITGGPGYIKQTLDPKGKYKGPYKDTSKEGLAAIETPDDQTIVFKLPKRNGDFEQFLAMPTGSPVKKEKDTKAKYTQRPFSAGPYKFQTYKAGKKIVLVRNDKWKKSSDPVRAALPDKIDVTISANLEENDKKLMAGDYDLDINGTGMTQSGRVTAVSDHRDSVDNMHTSFVRYVALIHTAKPLDDVHCRKAVFYATDFASLQQTRGGKVAAGDIANSTFPKAIPGYSEYDPYGVLERKGKPDIAKAKDELKQCGKPNGFSTKLTARNNNPGEVDAAEALQAQLKKAGINVEVDALDGADTSSITGSPSVVKKRGYGMTMSGWGPDFPSGQGYAQPLFDSRFLNPTGNYNESQIKDKKVDGLFDKAIAETDPVKAGEVYKELDKRILDNADWMPFLYEKNITWRGPRLTNAYMSDGYNGRYDYVSLGVVK
ncbi:ABC transporter substrate-binding protein [Streptomyces alfalfae]|uniref:ABC transporter substrate-binding protein n=1 Tax=Streptomyces alfalfae TaxID=1642299 RepID=A0A1P8TF40_9ACTN|nr:ABC transporter substrate-binding protein [Streptomyces alfalfae]AYA16623.1 ABC transporter substrate-binding protein [Streptomyces fradiae]APY86244.1 peptide ABC transporter substrate-binding protein [Streptomyces alfalfae]QQC91517.1 ABC transporter substrate-binding protein [Streptomyces alfalfae]QUI33999.1 ABC transporter substrate-binding protein [Streptomyces alfalfae]RXX48336.1 ABC transporter substrate-binding protein [Streptomyces alfalfae]